MHFFLSLPLKMYYFLPKESAISNVKPGISQWKATLSNDVEFPTVYLGIYRRKFFDVIQSDVALCLHVH